MAIDPDGFDKLYDAVVEEGSGAERVVPGRVGEALIQT